MAVKVTGQFVPAGDFSIVDAKDISGNITASNFSGSATSTGSFGHLVVQGNITASGTVRADAFESVTGGNAISFNDSLNVTGNVTASGDLSIDDLTASGRVTATSFGGIFEGALSSSAQIASNISGAFSVASTSFASDINALQTDSGSFSTRVTNLKSDSGSFSTRVTNLKSDSGSFSTRVTNLKTDSGSFSTRITNFSTGNVELVSGSATSTGSFGDVMVANNLALGGDPIYNTGTTGANLTITANNPYINLNDSNSTSGTRVFSIGSDNNKLKFAKMTDDGGTKVEQFLMNGNGNFSMGAGAGNLVEHTNSTGGNLTLDGNNPALNLYDNNATSGQRNKAILSMGGALYIGKTADNGTSAVHHIVIDDSGNVEVPVGSISGSSTSTGSFGLVLQNGSELSTFLGDRGTETLFSGSAASTGSFGKVEADLIVVDSGDNPSIDVRNSGRIRVMRANTAHNYLQMNADANGFNYIEFYNGALRFAPNGGTKMILHTNGRLGLNTTTDAGFLMDINGTGRFTGALTLDSTVSNISTTHVTASGNISASSFTGIFQGALSGSAQIASNISGAFAVASASFAADILSNSSSFATRITADSSSFATRITADSSSFSTRVTNLKTDSGSFSTRVTNLKIDSGSFSTRITANSSSFAARDTLSEATSSKILNGQLEFTNITASGNLSIGGVSVFDSHITASGRVNLDGKVFIQTGSIEGDLHVRTNENLMRIGKSTSGVIVSGSGAVSRFVTGSDGSIIDLGFTVTDEDGNVVLAGDGDGIHVDSNNYWYNNKYYRVGDARNDFLNFNPNVGIKYSGEVVAQTGSFGGEMFINSPTGSMFIGKFTGGIPSSGSDNISRFATGSDGSIIDLGFTTTDESGETVFTTTGDGIVVDEENYWYTTGHFKLGDGSKKIEWNTNNLNISASTVDVTTLKANDVNFAGLPTSDPLITGSLWISGSATSGSYKSGFVMISGIHG